MGQRRHGYTVMILLGTSLLFLTGCDGEAAAPVGESSVAATVEAEAEVPDPGRLRSIMIGLGANMDEVSRGLWLEDLAIVESAARAIAEHPHVSDTERTRIQGVLGPDFARFVQGDRRVHGTAVRLAAAAAAGEWASTLDELAELQAGCVACHQDFRSRLR